jgi:hypothetical protein
MGQGVFLTFQFYHLRNTFQKVMTAVLSGDGATVTQLMDLGKVSCEHC